MARLNEILGSIGDIVESIKEPRNNDADDTKLEENTKGVYPRDPFWIVAGEKGIDSNGYQYSEGDDLLYNPISRVVLSGDEANDEAEKWDNAREYLLSLALGEIEDEDKKPVDKIQPEIFEAVSDSLIDRVVDAMVYAPRAENLLNRIIKTDDIASLIDQLKPAIKVALTKMGVKVVGKTAAKMTVKKMVKNS